MSGTWVGTSGFDYRHWGDGVFYPAGLPHEERLSYYAGVFSTVEVNNTFYHLPEKHVFESWAEQTASGFRFVVKGSRLITHSKRLKTPYDYTERFFENARGLGKKLKAVLWQTPPNMEADVERLQGFLEELHRIAPDVGAAFEFRNESWFAEPVYDALREHKAALVFAHSPSGGSPQVVTGPLVYMRMHGGRRLYGSDYSEDELREFAGKAARRRDEGHDVYAFFNNDAHGYAVKNALRMKEMLSVEGVSQPPPVLAPGAPGHRPDPARP